MRVASGRGNDARKILTYYRVNFGLNSPFRVLCDGALIHQALQHQLYLRDSLPVLLGAPAQAAVTRCVVEELRALGEEVSAAALFAKRLTRLPCVHPDGILPAAQCLAMTVRGGNPKRLLIASNDTDLMRAVGSESFAPCIRLINKTRLVLMPPPKVTLDNVAELQSTKIGVQRPDDIRMLESVEREQLAIRKARQERRARMRARPKAPNPLSVKKSRSAGDSKVCRKTAKTRNDTDIEYVQDRLPGIMCGNGRMTKPKRVRKRKPKLQHLEQAEDLN
jgi:U3 small nucleolar RNA-associated protein 23